MIGAIICELNIIRINRGVIKALRQLSHNKHKHSFQLKIVIILL